MSDKNSEEKLESDLNNEEDEDLNSNEGDSEEAGEESELEEELKTGFDDFQFNNISWPSDEGGASPILERIAEGQPQPVFVGTIPQRRPLGTSDEEGDEFKYVPDSEQDNEAKYITTPSGVNTKPQRLDLSRVGRTQFNPALPTQNVSRAESYTPKVESPMPEKTWTAERIDTERAGREELSNPNKRDDIKYEKYKSRLDS